jgi:hypothetical protein
MDGNEAMIKIFNEALYSSSRQNLIDKSISNEELGNKTLLQLDFSDKYGFFMPHESLRKFSDLRERLNLRNEFIIKPVMITTRLKYWFYIIYIKLQQKKLRKKVAQSR